MELKNVKPRGYQERIFASAAKQNTLVILPTGTGKTLIALLLSLHRLKQHKGTKILFLAPTKPLCAQHKNTFSKSISGLSKDDFFLMTGETNPKKRVEYWECSPFIFATPQTIQNDLKHERISLEDVSLLIVDEAHRTSGEYAYVPVGKAYHKQANHQRILALTASPSSEEEKIQQICNDLNIQKIESLSEDDEEIKEHIPEKEISVIKIELPENMLEIQELFKKVSDKITNLLKSEKWVFGFVTKNKLIMLQKKISAKIFKEKNSKYYRALLLIAAAVKSQYFLELFEGYGISATLEYYKKIKSSKAKSANMILEDDNFRKAIFLCEQLSKEGIEHPKAQKLKEILEKEAGENNADFRAIVFTNFRASASMLFESLSDSEKLKPVIFIGKSGAGGLKQEEQINVINSFREGGRNVLIATSIGEEGIDIPSATLGVFFDSVPSAIRKIQRAGRIGRLSFGKLFLLVTSKTIDERYHNLSVYKEKKMKKTIKKMQEGKIKIQKTLEHFGE